jgi:predicted nucleotide-binding protein
MKDEIILLEDIYHQAKDLKYGDEKLNLVINRTDMLIRKLFGDSSHYLKKLTFISYTPIAYNLSSPETIFIGAFNRGKQELLNLINVLKEDVSLELTMNPRSNSAGKQTRKANKNIFIVQGQNEEMKQSVARIIEKLGFNPIILHEQPSKGRTIIEKFTDNSDALFAITILSADDIAYLKTENSSNARFRARQNVIFELGYFIGKLGRDKVLAIHELTDNFEIPSDYSGVIFVPYDNKGSWRFEIVKELKATGIEVDANQLL